MPRASQYGSELAMERMRPRRRQTDERSSSDLSRGRWPELRIIRRVSRDTGNSWAWQEYIDDLGELNYGKGHAFSLGSVACTMIDAPSMGRMLAKKYPKAFEDRKRTAQVQHRFQKDYNQFVRREEQIRTDARFEDTQRSLLILPDDDDFGVIDIEPILPDDVHEPRWNIQKFAVQGLDKFGRCKVALDLSGNEQLHKEWEETVDYLRHDGYDTNLITRDPQLGYVNFQPHISIFETFDDAGRLALRSTVDRPEFITLTQPKAFTS